MNAFLEDFSSLNSKKFENNFNTHNFAFEQSLTRNLFTSLPPLRRTIRAFCTFGGFNRGTCASSINPCSSWGILSKLPFGKLLLTILSFGIAII